MGTHKYNYNWDFFRNDSEELYYFLGFVAADGYIGNDCIEVGVNEKDEHIVKQFRDLIVPNKPLYHKIKTKAVTLKINCKAKIQKFKEFFGMTTNNKCYEVSFPAIPSKYVKDFVRGYIDGDGCIDSTKGYRADKVYVGQRLRILGNKCFLDSLNKATKEFVVHNTNRISKKGKENICVVTYNFSTASRLLEWIYNNSKIFLKRKKSKAIEVTKINMQ